jgi:DNA-binding transcriptional MocR family regulator
VDIAALRLRPGDRLPPQREFARQRTIANSTAARVYKELFRRGLTVGEVGRGTFVRAAALRPHPALAEPADSRVDLELNYAFVPEQAALQADGIAPLQRPDVLESSMRPVGAAGTLPARSRVAELLARGDWRPDQERALFAGNGRQAIAAAMAALAAPGARIGVEELSYPVVKAIAIRLGVTLVPLTVDSAGVVPEAVEAATRKTPLEAVYLQPTLHNPLSLTMPVERRAELADLLTRVDTRDHFVTATPGLAAGDHWEDWDLVFARPDGRQINPCQDWAEWKDLLAAAGIRKARRHDARHTAATLLLEQGVDFASVNANLAV